MQSTTIEQEPLLSGGNDSELSGTTPMQAYQKGALQGSSAIVVQVRPYLILNIEMSMLIAFTNNDQIVGLLFVALVWSLVFSVFPLFQGNSMPLFGYHPMVQVSVLNT
jgi:hypothetical protein